MLNRWFVYQLRAENKQKTAQTLHERLAQSLEKIDGSFIFLLLILKLDILPQVYLEVDTIFASK